MQKISAKLIDCDAIAHDLQRPGEACYRKIVDEFGYEVLAEDQQIDRSKLREVVFNSRERKAKLERIMHFEIFKSLFFSIQETFSSGSHEYVVLDAPLLYETGILQWVCYPVVVVYVGDRKEWLRRIMARDACDEKAALLKIKNQMPIEEKVKLAEIPINNMKQPEDMLKDFSKKFLPFITV